MVALEGNKGLPGTPVVLIHGLLCSVRFWTGDLLPVLAEQHHWISLSLPGHYPAGCPRPVSQAISFRWPAGASEG